MTETTSVEVVKCSRPRMPLSCWRHTTVAAPPMNPTIVACDRKSTMKPNLRRPSEAWKTPAKKVAVKARCRYRAGFSVGDTSLPSMEPMSSDATATVPTARSLELPISAYTSGGTKLE